MFVRHPVYFVPLHFSSSPLDLSLSFLGMSSRPLSESFSTVGRSRIFASGPIVGASGLAQSISLQPVTDAALARTHIVCTLGPASWDRRTFAKLLLAGLSVARLNFSHGSHEVHARTIATIREVMGKTRKFCTIMLDTKGPEIRTGPLADDSDGSALSDVTLTKGDIFRLYVDGRPTTATECSVTYPGILASLSVGKTILLDDGLISLTVKDIAADHIVATVNNTGQLGGRKGVNLPGSVVTLPVLTEQDKQDLLFGIEQGVDVVAASFVRKAEDVRAIRALLDSDPRGQPIRIISKIESQEGVENYDEILALSDGIMVARGDLGVEVPLEKVGVLQKMMVRKCNLVGKPVIVATQMLESMITNPRPTRAEATDVLNAVFDGCDCVMLSGETAKGAYPVKAVLTMRQICREAEMCLDLKSIREFLSSSIPSPLPVSEGIARAAVVTAAALHAKLLIVPTNSGQTAYLVAKYRPEQPVLVLTSQERTARQCLLRRGLFPLVLGTMVGTEALIRSAMQTAKQQGLCAHGDLVVATSGMRDDVSGLTNLLKVISCP